MVGVRCMADLGGAVCQRRLRPNKRRSDTSTWTSAPGRQPPT